MEKEQVLELKKKAKELRKAIIDIVYKAQSGHPGGSLSEIDMLVALYFSRLNVDPKDPKGKGRDKFVLSKGHASPGLYAVLAEKGFFPKKELDGFRKIGSMLQGHPELATPGIEYAGGSLGQGICFAVGLALAGKLDKSKAKVVVMIGDGEAQEGAVWEASMAAHFHKLDNLIAILDKNQVQETGRTEEVMAIDPAAEKWKAFGWNVAEINGHDMGQVVDALGRAWSMQNGKPTMIVSNTVKGKGVSFMELNHKFHGKAPNEEEYKKAIAEIEAIDVEKFG
ncbi:TPA: transketolase [Candidatus Woesearchaeota archaeon]|nr:transketolase [Candidatus Woesearchaeota archaeon]HII65448.1 transketolase [Candidatus Woesearchaeota archaeon]